MHDYSRLQKQSRKFRSIFACGFDSKRILMNEERVLLQCFPVVFFRAQSKPPAAQAK